MTIGLHNLKPAAGSTHRKKRVGRGHGSGHGKTSTRGHKGDKVRGSVNPNMEGGQTPLHRRLPQRRGLQHRNPRGFKMYHKTNYALVNLYVLEEQFEADDVITPEVLLERGILQELYDGVKILATGEVSKKFTVHAHKFSEAATEKLKAAGGSVEIVTALRRGHEKRDARSHATPG